MRVSRYVIVAVAFSLFLSCEATLEETIQDSEASLSDNEEVVFYASTETPSATKAAVQEDSHSIWWEPGDCIAIFSGDTQGVFSALCETQSKQSYFSGRFDSEDQVGSDYVAVYPAFASNSCSDKVVSVSVPSEQVATAGSFDRLSFVSIAYSTNKTLQFSNLCGGIKLSLESSGIDEIVISSLDGTALSGTVSVEITSQGEPKIKSVSEPISTIHFISVESDGFQPGKSYYVSILPFVKYNNYLRVSLYSSGRLVGLYDTINRSIKSSTFGNITSIDNKLTYSSSSICEPDAVDLGLPSGVKWGSWNIGASSPEESGHYYSWGEIVPKIYYSAGTYIWKGNSSNTFSKYNSNSSSGIVDNLNELEQADDVAFVCLGEEWRMPTYEDFYELMDSENCKWTWATQNGTSGYKVVSRYNGRSIFLPAAGCRWYEYTPNNGKQGNYYVKDKNSEQADYLKFTSATKTFSLCERYYGNSIRAVYGMPQVNTEIPVQSISLNMTSIDLYLETSATQQLVVTISPTRASDKSVTWSSDNTAVATVSNSGLVTAISRGTATITATSLSGSKKATCKVVVRYPEPEAVDLGLPSGIKWASFNLGASECCSCGNLYAWGETVIKHDYTSSNYQYYDSGNSKKINKYNTHVEYGTVDNKTTLDLSDDVASIELGKQWRMPTKEEFEELLNSKYCTWRWFGATLDGKSFVGCEVKSKINGNYILLSAQGLSSGSYHQSDWHKKGFYWSSTLREDIPQYAYYLTFTSSGQEVGSSSRTAGLPIRPVCE